MQFLKKLPVSLMKRTNCRSHTANIEVQGHVYEKEEIAPKYVKLLPPSRYGGEYLVTLLTGSSIIGNQGANFIRHLFEVAKVPVVFEKITIGPDDTAYPKEYMQSVRRNRHAIHVDLQHDPDQKHKQLLLNIDLDLYVGIIHVNSIEGYRCRHPNVDITVIMENNAGNFSKLEYAPVPGMVETLKIMQKKYIERYFNFVYHYAIENNHKKVTFGHQEDEFPLGDGMYNRVALTMYEQLKPKFELQLKPIQELVRDIVMKPNDFDIICTTDRYGTFVASIASAVCGGASLFSATERGDHHAVFKPLQTRLSVTDAMTLSPYGIVRSCVDLLHYLGESDCANVLYNELMQTMTCRDIKTREFGGTDSGEYVICDIVNRLKCRTY
ncbi:isocitrate dehydrogenase [NAD] subunit 1, mitochondrial [Rhagoletis pomonella]|uniref:isocitrate dehydrogenase [NAD] subunit 1, mitochondrial n=1 Tax=Rhagoletis pomonella TaxID=28610 RepID=UPI0017823CBC|nr:isocitrate dehydrogenase [NAD] subunit 1, mitochondrial [Rhagoletis pomonella]